jgi:hypothetical protein
MKMVCQLNFMPTSEERKRGGAVRYRTKKLPGGKYIHIAVVRKEGPRGGRTVAGPVHKKKRHS